MQQAIARQGGITLLGLNHGSANQQYRQHVQITGDGRSLGVMGDCECPVGFNCKHVVATCLAWKAQAGGSTADSSEFENWLQRFAASDHEPPRRSPDSLLYVVKPEFGMPDVLVDFVVSRCKKDGTWTRGHRASDSAIQDRWDAPQYLRPIDKEIIPLLLAGSGNPWHRKVSIARASGHAAMELMVDTGRMFWHGDRTSPLQRGGERVACLTWKKDGTGHRLGLDLEDVILVPTSPAWYVDPEKLEVGPLKLPVGLDEQRLGLLAKAPPVGQEETRRVSRLLALNHPDMPTPSPVEMDDFHEPPVPRLKLAFQVTDPARSELKLSFGYGPVDVSPTDTTDIPIREVNERLVRIHRDGEAEQAARDTLLEHGVTPLPDQAFTFSVGSDGSDRHAALGDWFEFVETVVPILEGQGWLVEQAVDQGFNLSRADAIEGEVEEAGNDWFGLRFDLQVDGWQVPLLPLVTELLADYRPGELPETLYLDSGDGNFIAVQSAQIEPILQTIVDLFDHNGVDDSLQLSRLDAPRLLELGETHIKGAIRLKRLAERLRDFDGIKTVRLPSTFKGSLRDYQHQGLNWLQFLRRYELSGILADDMGLGKTVQALAHLAVEKRAGRMQLPSLIVAPTSLMGNWRREAEAFTPGLSVLVLHGPNRFEHFDTIDQYDLVLTTYPLLPRDHEVLLAQHWHYLILDEAQQIKNPRAQAAQLVRGIKANHRLCLTGTPMENHLGELWAQFDFLMPGFLGDQKSFARHYRTPIEQHGDTARLERLAQRTGPFMLRRTKDRVATELPPKSEFLRTMPIEGKQATLYESIRLAMDKKVRAAIAKKGLARSHVTILDALLKLRQVCCDPRLLPAGAGGNAGSAKLEMLMDILPEQIDEGRRILLFSQFTTMLGLIEKEISQRGIPYTKLTGQTRKRDEAIERFRSGEVN
ncbi:MAG: SNF2-related protein, partial [Wenzhouxiangella sp.]